MPSRYRILFAEGPTLEVTAEDGGRNRGLLQRAGDAVALRADDLVSAFRARERRTGPAPAPDVGRGRRDPLPLPAPGRRAARRGARAPLREELSLLVAAHLLPDQACVEPLRGVA